MLPSVGAGLFRLAFIHSFCSDSEFTLRVSHVTVDIKSDFKLAISKHRKCFGSQAEAAIPVSKPDAEKQINLESGMEFSPEFLRVRQVTQHALNDVVNVVSNEWASQQPSAGLFDSIVLLAFEHVSFPAVRGRLNPKSIREFMGVKIVTENA